jgi:Tfp pilus assembly protein PilP
VLKSPKGGFIALVQAPDNRTYTVRTGDKVFDGSVRAITQDAVVFSQDVNDPLSLVKQREVRKSIRPEAR